jgi:ABC-2 type transport system permease protein
MTEYFDVIQTDPESGMEMLLDNQISAVVTIPEGWAEGLLRGEDIPPMDLVKNPAQSWHPAIVEEMMHVLTEGLNVLIRNAKPELTQLKEWIEKEDISDFEVIGKWLADIGTKIEAIREHLFPPSFRYEKGAKGTGEASASKGEGNTSIQIFAYFLPMISSMFLLFLADLAARDVFRESRAKTLQRFQTLHFGVFPFVVSKWMLGVALVWLGSLMLFVFGAFIFGISWKHPLGLMGIALSFAVCASGLMLLFTALIKSEKRSDAFSSMFIMGMSLLGGAFFQAESMPEWIQHGLMPWMPVHWYIQSVHSVEGMTQSGMVWESGVIRLCLCGLLSTLVACWVLQKNLNQGIQS